MGHCHATSDADGARIERHLPGRPGDPGWTSRANRLFVDPVLCVAKAGIPWRDLPERFGHGDTAYERFSRWPGRAHGRRSSRPSRMPTRSG